MLPFATKAPDVVLTDYRDWLVHLFGSSSERWPGFRDAWTVWLATRHLLFGDALVLDEPMGQPLLYRLLQVSTGLGVLAWCLWQQRRGIEARTLVALTLAMGLAWLMLFGPAVEHATYAFLRRCWRGPRCSAATGVRPGRSCVASLRWCDSRLRLGCTAAVLASRGAVLCSCAAAGHGTVRRLAVRLCRDSDPGKLGDEQVPRISVLRTLPRESGPLGRTLFQPPIERAA